VRTRPDAQEGYQKHHRGHVRPDALEVLMLLLELCLALQVPLHLRMSRCSMSSSRPKSCIGHHNIKLSAMFASYQSWNLFVQHSMLTW